MARMIYFCEKCNSTYGAESGTNNFCPNCKIKLIETNIPSDFWKNLSDSQKELRRKQFANDLIKDRQQEKERYLATTEMITTTGFNCDGYKIVKHLSCITGDEATTISRSITLSDNGIKDSIVKSLDKTRGKALQKLKEAAHRLGGNAVTGVKFDYTTFNLHTAASSSGAVQLSCIICVTASGNAVVVEKIDG